MKDYQESKYVLTVVVIPPTNILFGITVPYFGACVLIGVPTGVGHGETSADEDKNKNSKTLKLNYVSN